MTSFLVSSAGRRGALVVILKSIAHQTGGTVTATDASPLSAAGQLADQFELVPRLDTDGFVDAVLDVAKRNAADVVVPTIDPEIAVYALNRDRFAESGIDVWGPSSETARLGFDKWLFYAWLVKHGIPTVTTYQASDIRWRELRGPVVAKPRSGSSSVGITFRPSVDGLPTHMPNDYIVQTVATGVEITVDFAIKDGQFLGAVPRQRLETRAGEVSKGVTVRIPEVEQVAHDLAVRLPGMYGVGNIQMFFDAKTRSAKVIEINPRFGGGYPLTHAAGADFVTAMLDPGLGRIQLPLKWDSDVTMLRYDDAVFVRNTADGDV